MNGEMFLDSLITIGTVISLFGLAVLIIKKIWECMKREGENDAHK